MKYNYVNVNRKVKNASSVYCAYIEIRSVRRNNRLGTVPEIALEEIALGTGRL
jgi:hypothetical protein